MILSAAMMEELLNNACANPCYYEVPQLSGGVKAFGDPANKDYKIYSIEVCCVEYEIVAKKEMGHWVIKSFTKT